jgi:hypothetical protein
MADDNDCLQMPMRVVPTSSPYGIEKPKLKRASKSQLSVPQHRRPLTASAVEPVASFSASGLLNDEAGLGLHRKLDDSVEVDQPGWASLQPWESTSAETRSKKEDICIGDRAPSSDIDGAGPNTTDESELDVCIDAHSRTSPEFQASRTEDEGAMTGSSDDVSEGLWD